jgi:hypothetical protein
MHCTRLLPLLTGPLLVCVYPYPYQGSDTLLPIYYSLSNLGLVAATELPMNVLLRRCLSSSLLLPCTHPRTIMYDYAHVSGVGPATPQVSDRSCAIIFPRVADVVISQSVLLRIYYRCDDYLYSAISTCKIAPGVAPCSTTVTKTTTTTTTTTGTR